MGKAIIISHAGKGQYTIDLEIDTFYLQQIKQKLEEEYTRLLFTDKANAEAAMVSESVKLQNAQYAVNAAIFIYSIDRTEANRKEIDRLALEAISSSNAYRAATLALNTVNTRLSAIRKRLDTLRSNDDSRKRSSLWCTDLADGKKDRKLFYPGDEIGVLEISGQESIGQVLLPSYIPETAIYNQTRDGFLESLHGLTPFEFLYNKTMLPGWQAWDHRYRSGVITDGNPNDGWTVQLDNTKSTEQQIPVNDIANDRILTGIHAQYMSCNDLAFGLKDHVILDVAVSGPPTGTIISATIIGFVEKPKPCLTSGFGYYALELDGTPQEWQHINDETGTWVKQPSYANDLTAAAFANGSEPTIRSWIGDDSDSDAPVIEFIENGSAIYQSGIKLADIPTGNPWRILGAALSPKRKFLYAVFSYSSASNKVWLGRYSLAIDPALKDDGSAADHTVILSASLTATATLNGNLVVDNDILLTANLSGISTLTGTLSVTPGWEMQEFDLGVNAIIGSIEGKFSFNSSCTRALSMWGFLHGAKRTPQATPGGGASWDVIDNYNDTWKEKLEITISYPDAKTINKTEASLTNKGRLGFITKHFVETRSYDYSSAVVDPIIHDVINGLYIRDYCYPVHYRSEETINYGGAYQIDAGYFGDDEIIVNETGSGTLIATTDGFNDADGVSQVTSSSGSMTMQVSISSLGANFPTLHIEQSSSSSASADGGNSTSTFSVIRGVIGIHSAESALYTYDYAELSYLSTSSCTPGSPATFITHEETTTTEKGQLWCGAPIDTSIGDPVFNADDTSGTSLGCDTGLGDFGYQCFHDVYSDSGPAPPLQEPVSPFGAGEPFSKLINHYFFDITGWTGDDSQFSYLVPTQGYEKVQGARASGRKHMAYWQNTRTPGSVREYKAYLTGGDPFTLDGLIGDVIYRAIHPT